MLHGCFELRSTPGENDVRLHAGEVRVTGSNDRLAGCQVLVELEGKAAPHPVVPDIGAEPDVEGCDIAGHLLVRLRPDPADISELYQAREALLYARTDGPDEEERPIGPHFGKRLEQKEIDFSRHEV